MKDMIQKYSNTDRQITSALLQPAWLNDLLSIGSISTVTLLIFSVNALLGAKSAIAKITEQSTTFPEQTVEQEPTNHTNPQSSDLPLPVEVAQDVDNEELLQRPYADVQTVADSTTSSPLFDRLNRKDGDVKEALTSTTNTPTVQDSSTKNDAGSECRDVMNRLCTSQLEQAVLAEKNQPIAQFPIFNAKNPGVTEFHFASPALVQEQPLFTVGVTPTVPTHSLPLASTLTTTATGNMTVQVPTGDEPTPDAVSSVTVGEPVPQSVEDSSPEQWVVAEHPNPVTPTGNTDVSANSPTVYTGAGGAALLGDTIQAQGSGEDTSSSPRRNDALTPTLDVQGVYLYQGESSARVRLRGFYPVSPNALFGAVVDLATGDDFAGTEGDGLSLSELYFTGSLPSYSNLRLTVGLIDLTSYFDRNSFAKDNTTHFFNPLFQTNPALASAGIGSRPGALLNWNITDNVEAKAAVFSSDRSLGDFNLDAVAGEIGFRAGNGIIRATYASDRDTGRDGVFGTREGDRENAFGINGELFIPQINLGLFARYGWLSNSDRDEDAQTYNLGFNFLDLFRKDDRLGLGYANGPDFSEDEDVWEVFYDTRLSPNLRAGVTLQARDGFSETVVGFRVKTDLQLYP